MRNFVCRVMPFVGLISLSTILKAKACEQVIEGNDAMQYNLKEIVVDAANCDKFTLTLKHTGKLPKLAMGHNWILLRESDFQEVLGKAISAGPEKDYVPQGEAKVLAATKLIAGGEQASVEVDLKKLTKGETYKYFCSFPGHFGSMHGQLIYK